MASHRDSEFPSHVENLPSAASSGFKSNFNTTLNVLASLPDPNLCSTSSMEEGECRETSGDSGFSEMELTSPGSAASPEPSNRCFSSMEVHDEDDDDDVSSTISDISGMSDLSGQDWKPLAPMAWVHRQIQSGVDPRQVLAKLVQNLPLNDIPPDTDDLTLWKLIMDILPKIPWRKKLPDVNTLDDVVSLIRRCNRILVLTGAGVSVSCGIPDFRSPKGIYARLARDFPDLPDPHAMFDIRYFNRDPRPFYKFAHEIYPGQFQPSPCHKFIRALETHGKLLRNYTQNIDTLEQVAGVKNVVQCHGSFATATCTNCQRKVGADEIRDDILNQRIPVCSVCVPEGSQQAQESLDTSYSDLVARGVMKPDIVFFGEGLPGDFHRAMAADRSQADLLLIIGSSLKVQPVALIPSSIPGSVPQVLINREPLPDCNVDVELLGDADVLVDHICRALGDDWTDLCWRNSPLVQTDALLPEDVVYNANADASSPSTASPETSRKRPASAPVASCSPEPTKRARTDDQLEASTSLEQSDGSEEQVDDPQWRDARHIKLRQMSSDSTRDSGIAEALEDRLPLSLAARLPENTYFFIPPNRYVFPGAEVCSTRARRRLSDIDSDLDSYDSSVASDSAAPSPGPASVE